jgi:signal transduction histidine kinase
MRNGLEVDVHVDLTYEQTEACRRPAPELETALYRIVQETLTNAAKNGRATRAATEVVESDGMIEVTVRDNGVGFDPAAATTGSGVLGVRERAELEHGSFEIESPPGHGTVVRATLPAPPSGGLERARAERAPLAGRLTPRASPSPSNR